MKVSEIIHSLAERIGYTGDLKEIVTNPSLQVDMPAEFTTGINNQLYTLAEAKINGDIKKHFTGTALGSMDATIVELMDEYGFSDDVKTTIKSEPSTYSKVKLFTKSLAEIKDQHAASASGDKKKLVDQINDLNSQVANMKTQMANEIKASDMAWMNKFLDNSISGHFAKYDYAMENVPADIQAMTARQLMEKELTAKGGKIKYNDGKIELVSATDDALPFTIDNKPVAFSDFADKTVFDNKLAKVRGTAPATPATPYPSPGGQPSKIITPNAKSQIAAAIADLKAGQ